MQNYAYLCGMAHASLSCCWRFRRLRRPSRIPVRLPGVVKDPDQAVVSGSQVTLTNQQTKARTTAVTDGQGTYTFLSLAAGRLCRRGRLVKGFKATVSPELKVTAGPDGQTSILP